MFKLEFNWALNGAQAHCRIASSLCWRGLCVPVIPGGVLFGAFVLAPDRVSKANWWLCLSPWDPAGCSLKKRHRPPSCRPTTFRRCCRNWVQCVFCSSQGRRPGNSINADQGDMKRNLSGGEGTWARVWGWDIVGFTSTHDLGSGTSLLL